MTWASLQFEKIRVYLPLFSDLVCYIQRLSNFGGGQLMEWEAISKRYVRDFLRLLTCVLRVLWISTEI